MQIGGKMQKLTKEDMIKISAGAVSASWISAIWKGLNVFTDLGRYLGSSIRRAIDGNFCKY